MAPTLFYDALEDQCDPRADLYLRRMTELVPKGKQRLLEESDFPCRPRMRLHVDCTGRVRIAAGGQGPVTCLVTVTKPDKSDLRRGVFALAHSLKIQSTRHRWCGRKKRRGDHTAPTVSKQAHAPFPFGAAHIPGRSSLLS